VGFLDRLFGTNADREYEETVAQVKRQSAERNANMSEDERAIARYRYLLQTAPPEAIEQVHSEAFAALTPEQRQQVFEALKRNAPTGDAPRSADPESLAVSATRSEMRQPGTLERAFSGGPGMAGLGGGFGSMFTGSLLGNIAGFFIASSLMNAFLPDFGAGSEPAAEADAGMDAGADPSMNEAGSIDAAGFDGGMGDVFGGDFGGDFGDFGF
jgi:hypothetical protein